MGKGSRNRQNHFQERLDNPQKTNQKKKKQMPKWFGSAVALVIVAAILIGVGAYIVASNGYIKRGRVLIESQTGKYDLNQQMITYLTWQNQYLNAYYYYLYCQYGIQEDTYGITKTYQSGDEYALVAAQSAVQSQLRDCVDDMLEQLIAYVAVCDEAYRNGVKLEDEDMASVDDGIKQLKEMQTAYGYQTLNSFLDVAMGDGMKKSDVEKALKMVALYNKYCTEVQVDFEKAVTVADLETYRDANPEDFFKVDYLTFAAESKAFAEELAACKTAEEFKALVLKHHLDENYKTAYNKYTTQETAKNELSDISGKINSANGNALTEALDKLGAEAATDFTKGQEGLDTDLSKWLFDSARKQFDTATVATENGIYIVAFLSEKASTETVNARYKFLEFVEGEKHGEDDKFKETIYTHLTESKKDEPTLPTVEYKEAADKAIELKKALEAEGADVAALMKAHNSKTVTGVTASTPTTTIPKAVRDEVVKSTVKEGAVVSITDSGTYYVAHVDKIANGKTDVTYAVVKSDLYYQIIDELTTSLDKVYPTDKAASYKAKAEKDSFEAWISELKENGKFVSARAENETKYFEKTEKDVTTYNTYMVVKNKMASDSPMYLDTETVVGGGYYQYTTEKHAEEAKNALDTLKDKTNVDLLNALSTLGSTNTSSSLRESSVSVEAIKEWLFSADRTANEVTTITAEDGKSTYVVVFTEKMAAWESAAKSAYVSDKVETWMDDLSKNYTAKEKVLAKLGEPTTTAAETATDTAEETTADPHAGHDHD